MHITELFLISRKYKILGEIQKVGYLKYHPLLDTHFVSSLAIVQYRAYNMTFLRTETLFKTTLSKLPNVNPPIHAPLNETNKNLNKLSLTNKTIDLFLTSMGFGLQSSIECHSMVQSRSYSLIDIELPLLYESEIQRWCDSQVKKRLVVAVKLLFRNKNHL